MKKPIEIDIEIMEIVVIGWLIVLLLLLFGCGHNTSAPTPTISLAQWTSDGNPDLLTCSANVQTNCKLNYTLTDTTTGNVIADIPIGQLAYTINSIAPDTYSLAVNVQVVPGQIVSAVVTATAK